MRSFKITFAFAALLFIAPVARAQSDSLQKTNDIRVLLELLEVGPAMRQSLVEEIASERQNAESDVPPEFWNEFEKEAVNGVPQFVETMIPLYDQQFSHEEIKQLIAIHQQPIMRKYTKASGLLSEAAEEAGRKWGEEVGQRVALRILNEQNSAPDATPANKPAKKGKK